ncbi:IspD/TarI family cytidylyltransferase [Amycolatopsis jiangsuensis]|uniref:2-C-methyl-D-erythritol 4-phosphate cytidylyltransferase n=1 Tax=Amycolatopsis jiangsuensis TaxID=1181879 RepID=A0A840J274_9PSEU|nr:2-C-methyl-D-erythritol 4-phosphate cytidylyltransferase [Amycolatopsis jiangsuensis]MBB4687849.1 2-C-methyl-D-erythritol 4-phosphate cytidylyltransferase [Amycolatopsis jiangsuensis]
MTVAHHPADSERALVAVRGEALLTHTVRGLLGTPEIDLVAVAAPERCARFFSEALPQSERCRVLSTASLRDAFAEIAPKLSPDSTILVHDALRAFTPQQTIRLVLNALAAGAERVVPVLPMSDTVKTTDAAGVITATVDRDGLRSAQTPIGYSLSAFRSALSGSTLSGSTDPGLADAAGATTVPGDPDAMRVASAFELTLAEALVAGGDREDPL